MPTTFPENENIQGLRAFTPDDLESNLVEEEPEDEMETSASENDFKKQVFVAPPDPNFSHGFGNRIKKEIETTKPSTPTKEDFQFKQPKLEMFTQDEVVLPKNRPQIVLPKHPPLAMQPHLWPQPVSRPPFRPSTLYPPPKPRVPKSIFNPISISPRQRPNRRYRRRRRFRF